MLWPGCRKGLSGRVQRETRTRYGLSLIADGRIGQLQVSLAAARFVVCTNILTAVFAGNPRSYGIKPALRLITKISRKVEVSL